MKRLFVALALLVGAAPGPRPFAQSAQPPAPCAITTAGRVVAVGDVHGAFDQLIAMLREAQLIDNRRRWIGRDAIFVQVGDVLDRGPASKDALDLIRRLEGEASGAGGRVVFLLGNHEAMRMAGDLRYVSSAEYDAFKSSDAADLRERLYEHLVAQNTAAARGRGEAFDAKEFRKVFLEKTPLGSVEMQIAFSDSGEYGRWLREHDVMARINGIAFVHGGPDPASAAAGCEGTNARARAEIKTAQVSDPGYAKSFLGSATGPLWYRGLVSDPPDAASPDDVTAVLKALGASRIVVGHTVSPTHRVRSLFDGRVFQIDTGMLDGTFFPGGAPSALEIQNGTFTAIYEAGKREVLLKSTPAG